MESPEIVAALDQLSSSHKSAFRKLFGSTPVVALPSGGMTPKSLRPQTVEDVLVTVEHIVGSLKHYMAAEQELRDQANADARDMDAAARVFKRMGLASSSDADVRSAFKSVLAAVQIRHEFTDDDVREIASKHGVEL